MTGLLFVNAPEATHKQVNKMLVYLNDWEYGNYHAFKFVSTKNAYDLDLPSDAKEGQDLDGSVPPLDPDFRNAWAGAHLSDIEAFCRDLERNGVNGVNPELYILVDSAGLHQKTCVLGMRVEEGWNAERKTMYYSEHFRRFRMPWDEAYLTWCNLDIHNMDFESFVEEDIYEMPDRGTRVWWTYHSVSDGPDLSEENRQKREDELERLRVEGSI